MRTANTLLARMGAADKDVGERKHDWGCQYMALPSQFHHSEQFVLSQTQTKTRIQRTSIEYPIERSRGIVGFVDVVHWFEDSDFGVGIEVKVHQVSVGEILRQVKTYEHEAYPECSFWIVATGWRLWATDVATLHDAGFGYVCLGADFERYCEARREENSMPLGMW